MNRMLIVDDMPIIADGLAELLQTEASDLPLEIFRAYSASEALEYLYRYRIDIVMTDIRMPEKSGVELLKDIRAYWPDCCVIFLTSYGEFDYAQEAVRLGAFDYVLKTELDETIVAAARKAYADVQRREAERARQLQANRLYRNALPALQREWVVDLLAGRRRENSFSQDKLSELGVELDGGQPVLLLVGRTDRRYAGDDTDSQSLSLFAVRNVATELLGSRAVSFSVAVERDHALWLLQPAQGSMNGGAPDDRFFRYVYETLEAIQSVCRTMLKISVSFMLSREPMPLEALAAGYYRLKNALNRGIGLGQELILYETDERPSDPESTAISNGWRKMIRLLDVYLENGRRSEFMEAWEEFRSAVYRIDERDRFAAAELRAALASLLLSYTNRFPNDCPESIDRSLLLADPGDVAGMGGYLDQCGRMAARLLDYRTGEQHNQINSVIGAVREEIRKGLRDDLSVTRLAEMVYLHPGYLSRLFKQSTGLSLSDYIAEQRLERAKELLINTHMKVHEVGSETGYPSPISFVRFFKARIGMTPQEYRESQAT